MNNENIKKFYELLKTDKALAGELQNAENAQVLQFAAKRGLADEELEQVNAAGAGAAGNPARAEVGGTGKALGVIGPGVTPRARR